MAAIMVHAGDVAKGRGEAFVWGLSLSDRAKIPFEHFEYAELANEAFSQKSGLGAGLAGGLLFGGVGAVAGVLLGRKQQHNVGIAGRLLDGRRIIATLPGESYSHLRAALFMTEHLSVEERRQLFRADEEEGRRRASFKHRAAEGLRGLASVALLLTTGGLGWAIFDGDAPTPKDHPRLVVPSDPAATYVVLEKGNLGKYRTITTKRTGKSGTTFSKWLHDCDAKTVKYLGHGDTRAEMDAAVPAKRMSPLTAGSISYHVGVEACTI